MNIIFINHYSDEDTLALGQGTFKFRLLDVQVFPTRCFIIADIPGAAAGRKTEVQMIIRGRWIPIFGHLCQIRLLIWY
jgi:hypothetical protein